MPEERRHIAAVFVNRLKIGMKLQSDPTIIYGITRGYPLGRGIRESEIKAPTPLQHLCDRRPAARADLQSRQGFAGRGARPGSEPRSVFRRRRQGRPCFRGHHGRASKKRRQMAEDRRTVEMTSARSSPPSASKSRKPRRSSQVGPGLSLRAIRDDNSCLAALRSARICGDA